MKYIQIRLVLLLMSIKWSR